MPSAWASLGGDRFRVDGVWPRSHRFFGPVDGLHDPLLLVESMRQSTILLSHAAYGVPLDSHFLMRSLDYTASPECLAVEVRDRIDIEVAFSEITRRGGRLAGMRSDLTVRRNGRTAGTGSSRIEILSARAYCRVRGDRLRRSPLPPPENGVPHQWVGRTRPEDVLLVPTARADRWQLRVDTGHSTLYQGLKDHIPGMVLIEAARQAAHTAIGRAAFRACAGTNTFHRYAEFGGPLWIRLEDLTTAGPDGTRVTVEGRQDGEVAFVATLTARCPKRAR